MRTPSAPPGTTATKAKRRRRGLAVIASVIGLLGAPAVASAHGFYDWSQPGGPAPDGAYIVSISYTPDARTQRRKGRPDRRHLHLRVVRRLDRPLRRHRRLLLTDVRVDHHRRRLAPDRRGARSVRSLMTGSSHDREHAMAITRQSIRAQLPRAFRYLGARAVVAVLSAGLVGGAAG
jgi:hypothetical protein